MLIRFCGPEISGKDDLKSPGTFIIIELFEFIK